MEKSILTGEVKLIKNTAFKGLLYQLTLTRFCGVRVDPRQIKMVVNTLKRIRCSSEI